MIRPARPDDAPAIAAVERAAAHAPWSPDTIARSLGIPGTVAVVAEVGGTIVGHALSGTGADVADLHTIAVHPDARRRGVARDLLAALEAAWIRRGVTEAFLEVRIDNTAARALYTGAGWEPVGTRRGYYADGTDAVVLRKALPGG